MAESKLAIALGKVIKTSSNLIGTLQIGANKILWGSGNIQPTQTVKYDTVSGSLSYTSNIPNNPQPPKANLVNSGLFNALDALNGVDLCNVLTYATDQIHFKKKPRPSKPWNATQTALYFVQDQCAVVQTQIDKYMAYPNVFVGSYVGLGPNAMPIAQAVSESNAPAQGGTEAQKYNLYNLMLAIKETFTLNSAGTGSLFTAEDATLLTTVPGLGGNLNIIDDFIGQIDKYTDYRQIPNQELQRLINKVSTIRSVCVTIQNLDFKSGLALVGNFLGTDIRAQIQELGKFIDVTKIIPTLKQINSAIQSFIKIGRQIQGVLTTGQFLIKLALLFYKVFKFIIAFFAALPIPMMFNTAGWQTAIQDAKDKAKNEVDGIARFLKTLNALLAVALTFVRYVLANANELLIRLDTLLLNLQACEAVKDSDVISELQQTRSNLAQLRDDLAAIVIKYDSKTNPNNSLFGDYDIRVVEEEVTDRAVINKRRRGIALDKNGNIVASSDLTFATNTGLIIAETQQKLLSLGLVQPGLGKIDSVNLAIISESLNYLDNEDILQNDLNVTPTELDSPDNQDESKGLGLNAFVNNLKGGKKLRKRVQAAVAAQTAETKDQIATEVNTSRQTLKISS